MGHPHKSILLCRDMKNSILFTECELSRVFGMGTQEDAMLMGFQSSEYMLQLVTTIGNSTHLLEDPFIRSSMHPLLIFCKLILRL